MLVINNIIKFLYKKWNKQTNPTNQSNQPTLQPEGVCFVNERKLQQSQRPS